MIAMILNDSLLTDLSGYFWQEQDFSAQDPIPKVARPARGRLGADRTCSDRQKLAHCAIGVESGGGGGVVPLSIHVA